MGQEHKKPGPKPELFKVKLSFDDAVRTALGKGEPPPPKPESRPSKPKS